MPTEIREALEAAIKESEPTEEAAHVEVDAGASVEPAGEPAEDVDAGAAESGAGGTEAAEAAGGGIRQRDQKGRFAGKAVSSGTPTPTPVTQPKPTVTPAPTPTVATPTPAPKFKAPQSWKPQLREKFSTLPVEVQAEVDRREREATTLAQQAAESRKFHESFQQAVQPFQSHLAAKGVNPVQAFQSLLQTQHALETAPPQQRAAMAAQIIRNFGVDIAMLDEELSRPGGPTHAPQGQQHMDPTQIAAQVRQSIMQDLQRQRQHVELQRAQKELASFEDKEFFEDVRETMADIMEIAAKRGVVMTTEQAYNQACQMHPDVSAALSQRPAVAPVPTANPAATARAKAAASSVRSSPAKAPEPSPSDSDDLRAQLAREYAKMSGR